MVDMNYKMAGFNPPQTEEERRRRMLMAYRPLVTAETDAPTDADIETIDGGKASTSFDAILSGGAADTTFTQIISGGSASTTRG